MNNPAQIASNLRDRLKLRNLSAKQNFVQNHPHAANFFEGKGIDLGNIRRHSAKLLTAGALGGSLLLAAPEVHAETQNLVLPAPLVDVLTQAGSVLPENPKDWLVGQLAQVLPPITNRWALPFLNQEEEKIIEKILSRATGIPARASLEGEHLNTVYGYTGYEQHLMRFIGDTLSKHDEFREAGMAPGLGGFGYFTEGGKITDEGVSREKWYMVVQTLYLPDWDKRWKYLVNWYKWRKLLMVDVENGNAVVGVVGDAGPAAWTGKHFGASPEVMNALGGPKFRKGRILVYFVDDPDNKIPLGPVDYNKLNTTIVKAI